MKHVYNNLDLLYDAQTKPDDSAQHCGNSIAIEPVTAKTFGLLLD